MNTNMFNPILRAANNTASQALRQQLDTYLHPETTVTMSLMSENQVYITFNYLNAEICLNVYITYPTIEHAYFSNKTSGVESYGNVDFPQFITVVQQLLNTIHENGVLEAVEAYERLSEE